MYLIQANPRSHRTSYPIYVDVDDDWSRERERENNAFSQFLPTHTALDTLVNTINFCRDEQNEQARE